MENSQHKNSRIIIKYAGAFIAWTIGSGFATGQEILQFFSSYGMASYGIVFINLAGFLLLGLTIVLTGFTHQNEKKFNNFHFFCGEKLGTVYSWLIPATLFLIMSVLTSGAGAALYEYFGISRSVGSAIMAAMVLCAYLAGFKKLISIVSMIGPVIIAFILLVGTISVIRDFGNFSEISRYSSALAQSKAAPNWILSSFLYLSLTFLGGSTYFTALGASAEDRKSVKAGVMLGAGFFILTILIVNTAILLNAKEIASLDIPTLFLAKKISVWFAGTFAVILVLGIFASCSAMMWTVCNKISVSGTIKTRILAAAVTAGVYVLSLFSFSKLLNIFYPIVGYMGLIFIGCVAYKGISTLFTKKKNS